MNPVRSLLSLAVPSATSSAKPTAMSLALRPAQAFGLALLLIVSMCTAAGTKTPASKLIAERTSDSTVYLSWQPAQDDRGVGFYRVFRTDMIKGLRHISTVVNPRLADIQLGAGVEYTYYVVAFTPDGERSSRSDSVVAAAYPDNTTPDMPDAPQAPDQPPQPEPTQPASPTTPTTPADPDATPGVPPVPILPVGPEVPAGPADPPNPSGPTGPTAPTSPPVVPRDDGTEPVLAPVDFTATPRPGPNPDDPFNSLLEVNPAVSVNGLPTAPANLRADLVSNDWAELNWAASSDDGEIVAYNIYRSDGHVYTVARDAFSSNGGVQAEVDKYFRTTSFIDCNFTRFFDLIHFCQNYAPSPGDRFSYQVTAVDNDGNESQPSNSLQVDYHIPANAPIPLYDDFYKAPDDVFLQLNDLSQTRFFLDEFDLVFNEDFNGPALDETRWQTSLTWGDTRIINGEQQYFVDTQRTADLTYDPFRFGQAATGESTLTIEAIPTPPEVASDLPDICREPDPFDVERCAFLSGALSSHDRFGMTYGYVEGRLRASGAAGALSSFYLYHRYAGQGINAHAPEIDILEYLGENPFGDEDAFQTYHFDDVVHGGTRSSPTMAYKKPEGDRYDQGFHTFGVLWEPQVIIWYIDGREVKRITGHQVARQQMNIVAYLVAGSAWAPTPDVGNPDLFPLSLEIDYIRAWQRPVYNGNGLYPGR